MRIAICDDDIKELNNLSKLLNDYREKRKVSLMYMPYSDGFALLEYVRKGGFDFLILDVMMPLVNGMEIAHEIRDFDENIKIAFLTSSPDFAVESYSVEAFGYLLKPATADNLFPLLDKFYRLSQKSEVGLIVKLQNGVDKLPFSKIAFVEVINRVLYFHLTDGNIKKLAAPLSEYEDALLQRPEFIRVHRSYIVNLWQIQELRSADIQTYTGDIVPVSRRLYAQVRNAYMDHLFEDNSTK